MDCDICHRGHDAKRLPFLCAVDARNQIYEGRIKSLQALIQNESLQREINDLLSHAAKPNADTLASSASHQSSLKVKTDEILAAADKLRDDIKAARDEIQAKKKDLARRKSELANVSQGVVERRAKQQQDIEKVTQKINYRWSQDAENAARTRVFLCLEAARLYGLRRVIDENSGMVGYEIGQLPIVDLKTMNTLNPEVISTSLGYVAHILTLICYYLSIRLPAQITLPHRDYPRATIFNLSGSYQQGDVSFSNTPGATPSQADSRSADSNHTPRPRPLYIDKPLPQLSKEDPTSYSFFLEGVTLLAYNVAWLCNLQGVPIGENASFEDMCDIGKNLYNLLVVETNKYYSQNGSPHVDSHSAAKDSSNPNLMGRFSHGSTFYNLGGAQGAEILRSFKVPGPMKLRDKLKRKLLGDAPDWEVLDDDAWKVEEDADNGVMVDNPLSKVKTIEGKSPPKSGSNGWMRVKNR